MTDHSPPSGAKVSDKIQLSMNMMDKVTPPMPLPPFPHKYQNTSML